VRYRPFGLNGQAMSVLTLALDRPGLRAAAVTELVFSALECGINSFELQAGDVEAARGLRDGLGAVERTIAVIGLRLSAAADPRFVSRDGAIAAIESALDAGRFGRLDYVLVEGRMPNDLSPLLADTLAGANAAGRIRVAGLGGKRAFLDAHLDAPEFELIEAPFNLRSDWDDRNRVKRAVARGMTVIGCDYYPALQIARRDAGTEPRQGLLRFGLGGKERSLEQSSTYAFLSLYQGWTAEEICLAYALTEPGLSSIHISAAGVRNLPALAAAPEREMPTGVPAQIEMARIQAS
jgi:hypothetical protein